MNMAKNKRLSHKFKKKKIIETNSSVPRCRVLTTDNYYFAMVSLFSLLCDEKRYETNCELLLKYKIIKKMRTLRVGQIVHDSSIFPYFCRLEFDSAYISN